MGAAEDQGAACAARSSCRFVQVRLVGAPSWCEFSRTAASAVIACGTSAWPAFGASGPHVRAVPAPPRSAPAPRSRCRQRSASAGHSSRPCWRRRNEAPVRWTRIRGEPRSAVTARDPAQQVGGEHPELGDVDPIPGAEQHVIEHGRAVIERQRDPLAGRDGAMDAFARTHAHAVEPRPQPARSTRTQASRVEPRTHTGRHHAGSGRLFGEPVERKRSDPRG